MRPALSISRAWCTTVSEGSLLAEYLPRLPGSPLRSCVPTRPLDDTPPPANDNLAVAIGGIASSTRGHPDDIFSAPARLGYEPVDTFRFSYRGSDGDRLHEPYGPEDTWGDLRGYASDLAEQLRRLRAQHPGRAIDLIAHSQGGIVARYMLCAGGFRVGRIDANDREPHHDLDTPPRRTTCGSGGGHPIVAIRTGRAGSGHRYWRREGRSASTPRVSR